MSIFKSYSPVTTSQNTVSSPKGIIRPSGTWASQPIKPLVVTVPNPKQYIERLDKHDYYINPIEICDTNKPNCTIDKVFKELLSDNTFSRPIATDFHNLNINMVKNVTNDFLHWIGAPEYFRLESHRTVIQQKAILYSSQREELSRSPVTDNKIVNLYAKSNEYIALIAYLSSILQSRSFTELHNNLSDKTHNYTHTMRDLSDVNNNPIRQVIDKQNFKIINYTMPGHILHSGQVEVQITQQQNKIFFTVRGRGNSDFYDVFSRNHLPSLQLDKIVGIIMSKVINAEGGKELFMSVGERFKTYYQSKCM